MLSSTHWSSAAWSACGSPARAPTIPAGKASNHDSRSGTESRTSISRGRPARPRSPAPRDDLVNRGERLRRREADRRLQFGAGRAGRAPDSAARRTQTPSPETAVEPSRWPASHRAVNAFAAVVGSALMVRVLPTPSPDGVGGTV